MGLGLLGGKSFALHEGVDEFNQGKLFFLGGGKDADRQVLIRETKGTTQTIPDQVLGETTGKIVFFL